MNSPVLKETVAVVESPGLSDVCWSLLPTGLCSAAFAGCLQHTEMLLFITLFISYQNEQMLAELGRLVIPTLYSSTL